ncbi:MAG: type II toxin-antitoxin system Phd/YefM family antitoxin [Acidobacteriota bacterium]
MKEVSIQDLKAHLSSVVAQAEAGETIVVTRHKEPAARLVPPGALENTHRGARVGQGSIRPLFRRASQGRYLEVLLEDRSDR